MVQRSATTGGRLIRDEETLEPFRVRCCPEQVVDKDGVPLLGRDLARRKRRCPECGAALWQADRSGPKRYPLSDYVKHRLRGFFELLIGDEVHEFKAHGSAQGIAENWTGAVQDVAHEAAPGGSHLIQQANPSTAVLSALDWAT